MVKCQPNVNMNIEKFKKQKIVNLLALNLTKAKQ